MHFLRVLQFRFLHKRPGDEGKHHLQLLCERKHARSLTTNAANPELEKAWSLDRDSQRTALFMRGWVHSMSREVLEKCYVQVKMEIDTSGHYRYIFWDGDLLKNDSFTWIIGQLMQDYRNTRLQFFAFKKQVAHCCAPGFSPLFTTAAPPLHHRCTTTDRLNCFATYPCVCRKASRSY
jgi:hypothetical protein